MADLPIPKPDEIEHEWIFSPKKVHCLKDLASDKLVQILWRTKIEEKRIKGILCTIYDNEPPTILDLKHRFIEITWNKPNEKPETSNCKENISAPLLAIQSAMQEYACFLKKECQDWDNSFVSYKFLERPTKQITVLDRFHDFIYENEGFIDDVRTARSMISCGRFSVIDQYAIACSYCFEDEIRRIWPLLSKEMDIVSVSAEEHYLIHYWTHVMMNQTETLHSASTMLLSGSFNESSMQFFFDQIPTLERKAQTVEDIFNFDMSTTTLCMRYLIPKQDDEFLKVLVSYFGFKILLRLMSKEYDRFYVLPFWMRTRDFFSGDAFVKMLLDIIDNVQFYLPRPIAGTFEEEQRLEHIFDMYTKLIWDNSPVQLKQFATKFFQFEKPDYFEVFNSIITGTNNGNA
ncbi:uncharacterized protein LOC135841136 [Planococcus citri]|uniref:uncharacterized protein LOC135841136 n=1 Tax=Planococcus citri TaxID=170843 RepID=UPI0031F72D69